MASQETPTNSSKHRRLAIALGLCAGLAAIVAILAVIPRANHDGWGILNGLRSSSSATPEPEPTSKSASGLDTPPTQLMVDCIRQTKGPEATEFFLEDIPEDRWGDPVSGTLTTFGEPYVLWLFDAECKSYEAVAVPRATSRTFEAYVGQVWYYAEASVKQPGETCDCRVFSPANSGVRQEFSDTGALTYRM
ncbi:hypothetical protein E0H26_28405 [Micromonospora zingiberis]|uniref:Uncharacterized protein n=1 Tax=Micromonospora zingiberis TaxID=2053011 RepID=A0A4R0FX40_9ACTN|nr:hypothetical protein [Micromonospora zingiberis]TCB88644.1 hypothetical protein E0H26_28405 [Micromonospora zingiberis]